MPKRGRKSLPISEWPQADRRAWEEACRPGHRFRKGGTASHLGDISRDDIAYRYALFLGFLHRQGRLNDAASAAMHTTPENVKAYIAEIQQSVRTATVYNCIHKLRRASELLAPQLQFGWLAQIEKELALHIEPQSKYDRLVLSNRLLEAGLTLIIEAERSIPTAFRRALGVRNGLAVAMLSLCPIRRKNFLALEIGDSFRLIGDQWWIILPGRATKSRTPLERRVPSMLKPEIDKYVERYRPVLLRPNKPTMALWVSGIGGEEMHKGSLSRLISKITRETVGVSVSPHLFRTAAASSAAIYGGDYPYLASALLDHRDPRTTEEHYDRASSMTAAGLYADLVDKLRR